jgi:hypothetical protein
VLKKLVFFFYKEELQKPQNKSSPKERIPFKKNNTKKFGTLQTPCTIPRPYEYKDMTRKVMVPDTIPKEAKKDKYNTKTPSKKRNGQRRHRVRTLGFVT